MKEGKKKERKRKNWDEKNWGKKNLKYDEINMIHWYMKYNKRNIMKEKIRSKELKGKYRERAKKKHVIKFIRKKMGNENMRKNWRETSRVVKSCKVRKKVEKETDRVNSKG